MSWAQKGKGEVSDMDGIPMDLENKAVGVTSNLLPQVLL